MAAAIVNRQRQVPLSPRRLARAAARALAAVGRPAGEVEIDVVDDREIRRLNARFRGIRRRTDVLAFPLEIEGRPGFAGASPSRERGVKGGPSSPPFLVGQVVISAETARRQARRIGVPLATELDLLATHGVLHLAGYDDRDPVEADLMHRRERQILSAGGRRPPAALWRGLLHR
ncbi:MAG: rRNA maturation RNase YbeY [Candidatus Rokubacteria bacterium]|nr:rRNA maturation RNase YbeY [Candidatus Rokubacteria bacterium]